jgi:hypothetical protein
MGTFGTVFVDEELRDEGGHQESAAGQTNNYKSFKPSKTPTYSKRAFLQNLRGRKGAP